MAWEVDYRCDRCLRVQCVRTGDYRRYVVPWQHEGVKFIDRVPCSDQEGWCQCCRRLRPMESLPDIALLERMKKVMAEVGLSRLDRDLAAEDRRTEQQEMQRRLARIDEQIRWRRERRSPPKCFACGTTEVQPVDEAPKDGEGFRHPGCGGVFRIHKDPCHIQPAVGFLIPPEGPRVYRGLRWLWEWVHRGTDRCK